MDEVKQSPTVEQMELEQMELEQTELQPAEGERHDLEVGDSLSTDQPIQVMLNPTLESPTADVDAGVEIVVEPISSGGNGPVVLPTSSSPLVVQLAPTSWRSRVCGYLGKLFAGVVGSLIVAGAKMWLFGSGSGNGAHGNPPVVKYLGLIGNAGEDGEIAVPDDDEEYFPFECQNHNMVFKTFEKLLAHCEEQDPGFSYCQRCQVVYFDEEEAVEHQFLVGHLITKDQEVNSELGA